MEVRRNQIPRSTVVLSRGSQGSIFETEDPNILLKVYRSRSEYEKEKMSLLRLVGSGVTPTFIGYLEERNFSTLAMERFGISLRMILNQGVSSEQKMKISQDLTEKVTTMHHHRVYHLDLKPENILFDGNEVKICDFGSSVIDESSIEITKQVTTLGYRHPRLSSLPVIIEPGSIDLWSLQCILSEIEGSKELFLNRPEL